MSPVIEKALRGAGIGVMALSLPFLLAYGLGMAAVSYLAPEYMRCRNSARREYLDSIRSWQDEQLSSFREKPYAELASMPPRTELAAPDQFNRERFAVIRAPGENGGVEVGVAHFTRFLLITGRIMPSFEMLPDGSIVPEPSHEVDD